MRFDLISILIKSIFTYYVQSDTQRYDFRKSIRFGKSILRFNLLGVLKSTERRYTASSQRNNRNRNRNDGDVQVQWMSW